LSRSRHSLAGGLFFCSLAGGQRPGLLLCPGTLPGSSLLLLGHHPGSLGSGLPRLFLSLGLARCFLPCKASRIGSATGLLGCGLCLTLLGLGLRLGRRPGLILHRLGNGRLFGLVPRFDAHGGLDSLDDARP
jgi:hypothetical protein